MSALIQQTQEWHELRRDKIGSSDAPIIMGDSPFKTPYQLWEEKILGKKTKRTGAMERGIQLEPKALEKFSELTGLLVAPDVVFHPEHEWMMASLDAIDVERKHIAEIKCPGAHDQAIALAGLVPEKYFPQIQHQLEVCQIEKAYYFSFDGSNGVLLEVFRDDKYIKKLISKEREFWEKLKDLIPPQMTEKDYQPKMDDIWSLCASEWITLSGQIKELEKREKELRDMLVSMSQNQNSMGSGIKVSRMVRKGNIDYSKIPEIEHMNLEQYRKDPIECWKIIEV